MSTISSTSATNPYAYLTSSSTNPLQQNLSTLGTALQSGDSSSIQTALTSLQNTVAANGNSTTQPFGSNTQANTDYNNLVSAVQSGNPTDAQNALTQLQSDLKSAGHAGKGHGHHGGHHGGGTPPATDSTTTTDTSSTTPNDDGSGSVVNVTV